MQLKDFKESMFTLNCDGTWKLASIIQCRWTHQRQLKMDLLLWNALLPKPSSWHLRKNNAYIPKKISSNDNRLCKQTLNIYRADFNASHVSYASPRTTSTLSLYKIGFSIPVEETKQKIRNLDLLPEYIYPSGSPRTPRTLTCIPRITDGPLGNIHHLTFPDSENGHSINATVGVVLGSAAAGMRNNYTTMRNRWKTYSFTPSQD